MNSVNLVGNLGSDAELRATQGGNPILSFRVAVNERRKDAQGNWTDYTNWVPCTMFGSRAEKIAQYLTKGTKVACTGRLRYSQWDDKQTGQKHSKIEVIVDDLDFMSSGQRQQAPAAPQYQQQAPQYQQAPAAPQYQAQQYNPQQFQQQVQPASYQQPVQQQMPPQAPMQQVPQQQMPIQQMQSPIDPASIAYESEDIPF